jgi:single-stranded-DNA-specific exonuclease
MAAGLEVERENLGAFRRAFHDVAEAALSGRDLRPVLRIDAWVEMGDADERLLGALSRLRPFGCGNPTPVWGVRSVRVTGKPRVLKGKHLKFYAAQGSLERECIAWNMADRELPEGPIDLAFQLGLNRYKGRETLQLTVKDFRPALEADDSRAGS